LIANRVGLIDLIIEEDNRRVFKKYYSTIPFSTVSGGTKGFRTGNKTVISADTNSLT